MYKAQTTDSFCFVVGGGVLSVSSVRKFSPTPLGFLRISVTPLCSTSGTHDFLSVINNLELRFLLDSIPASVYGQLPLNHLKLLEGWGRGNLSSDLCYRKEVHYLTALKVSL